MEGKGGLRKGSWLEVNKKCSAGRDRVSLGQEEPFLKPCFAWASPWACKGGLSLKTLMHASLA